MDAHLTAGLIGMPQRISHSHVSAVASHVISCIACCPLMIRDISPEDFSNLGDLITARFLRESLVYGALVLLRGQRAGLRDIWNTTWPKPFGVIGVVMWDETQQVISCHQSTGLQHIALSKDFEFEFEFEFEIEKSKAAYIVYIYREQS